MEKKMTNRQIKALETRKNIVEAAKKLITKDGFENVGIEDIAKEAGVSTGSFYTYFKRKEDIIDEINQRDFYHLAEIANDMEDKDIVGRIKYYCHEFLKEIEDVGIEICRQWIRNNVMPMDMCLPDENITKYKYDYRAMQQILTEAVRRDELRSDTPIDELALFINAELYGLMVAWCMSDAEVIGSEKTDVFCEQVISAAIKPYQQ